MKTVMKHLYGSRIEAVVCELSDGAQPGSKEYFSQYAKGYSMFRKSLTKKECGAADAEREKWELDQPPPEVQQKSIILHPH